MSLFADAEDLFAQDKAGAVWNSLALATPQPDPFCATTHWQLSFREAIDPERPALVRHSDDGIIHFALHTIVGGGPVLGPIERAWLFGCNLLGPASLDLTERLLEELKGEEELSSCPLVISGLDPQGALLAAIKKRFGGRRRLSRFRAGVQCAASLEGGLDGFLARRSANQRRNLRRAHKRAHTTGIVFERREPACAESASTIFERMLNVERVSWKGIGQCGMDQPSMVRFYGAMLRRLSQVREARVIFAVLEGRDIGFIFGGVTGGLYRGQQFSFDDDYADFSVGNLLQLEQIRWLCEEGAHRYDLGPLQGARMAYKQHWTELHFPIEAWAI